MRPDAYGIVTAYGSPHLARKAEQVPQGLRDTGSSKRTCPLCSGRIPPDAHQSAGITRIFPVQRVTGVTGLSAIRYGGVRQLAI